MEVYLPEFLTPALFKVNDQISAPGALSPGYRHSTLSIRGRVGIRTCLEVVAETKKVRPLPGIETQIALRRIQRLTASSVWPVHV